MVTEPSSETVTVTSLPAVTGAMGPRAPDRITCPAVSGLPQLTCSAGEPDDGFDRIAQAGGSDAGGHLGAVDGHRHDDAGRFHLVEGASFGSQDVHARGRIVGDGVTELDVPRLDAAVADLDRGDGVVDRTAHLRVVQRSIHEVAPSTKATSASTLGWIKRLMGMGAPAGNSMSAYSTPRSGWSTPSCCWTAHRGQADLAAYDHGPPPARRISSTRRWTA